MGLFGLDHFSKCLGEAFDLDMGTSSVALTLAEAIPLPETGIPGSRRAPFSLMFRSALQIVLPQQMYRLKNRTIGDLDIFLVPVARNKEGIIYQAVFN